MEKHAKRSPRGFTLIEILIVIGIIAILASVVVVAINPAKQFAQARNTQRESGINTILNAIGQRMADNKGIFEGSFTVGATTHACPTLPSTKTPLSKSAYSGSIDISCLVPTYVPALPVDPSVSSSPSLGYTVQIVEGGRVQVCAPEAEEPSVPGSSEICATR